MKKISYAFLVFVLGFAGFAAVNSFASPSLVFANGTHHHSVHDGNNNDNKGDKNDNDNHDSNKGHDGDNNNNDGNKDWNKDDNHDKNHDGDHGGDNTATIKVSKIICDSESDLPNWGAGGPNITSSTASDFLASHPNCHSSLWYFQWAPSSAANPGDETDVAPAPWTEFSTSSPATVPAGSQVWVREEKEPGYIPFSGWLSNGSNTPSTDDENSAEMYCNADVLNYDNYDYVNPVEAGKTYNCIAFNVHTQEQNDLCPNIDGVQTSIPDGDQIVDGQCVPITTGDLCPNLDGVQTSVPDGYQLHDGQCVPVGGECQDNESNTIVSDTDTQVDSHDAVPVAKPYHHAWTASISDATWIWSESNIVDPVNETTKIFTRDFNISGTPKDSLLEIASDNTYDVSVNGHEVCSSSDLTNFTADTQATCSIPASDLLTGSNTITFTITNQYFPNGTVKLNPAGLLYKLIINDCGNTNPPPVENSCPVPDALGSTTDQTIGATPSDEETLQTILDNSGYSSVSAADDQAHYQVWNVTSGMQVDVDATYFDKYSANDFVFGYYVNGDVSNFTPVFKTNSAISVSVPLSNTGPFSITVPSGASTMGFAIRVYGDGNTYETTEDSLNQSGHNQTLVFNPSANDYIVAFEDTLGGDYDYNDLVVKVSLDCSENNGGGNQSPTADAGPDQTITLPTDSVTLDGSGSSDPDGTIASYVWTEVSGPSTVDPDDVVGPDAGGLVEGTYVFELTVTDNDGATGTDTVSITVNPANSGGNPECSDSIDNDGDNLIDSADPGCHTDGNVNNPNSYNPNDNDETNVNKPVTRIHHSGGGPVGQVLGAQTSCGIYVDKYLRVGYHNDPENVRKVQTFLNSYMNAGLVVDGIYGPKTADAVGAFQVARAQNVLAPWGLTVPTKIFYLTTQTEVNNIMCPSLGLPIPAPLTNFSLNPNTPNQVATVAGY
ncbi:MAG TPA: peptidoglycan-binding protein [Candidatus Paceibacterota bacterium]|nr:peptidoglycan-binding protein [Candidatus Paceibacterota bacterium]